MFRLATVHGAQKKRLQGRKVPGAEGEEGDVVKTRIVEAIFEDFFQIGQAALAGRAVEYARLTEAAAARAAARDFETQAVVHRAEGHDLPLGVGRRVEIRDDPASRRGQAFAQRLERARGIVRVEGRRIDARNGDGFADKA